MDLRNSKPQSVRTAGKTISIRKTDNPPRPQTRQTKPKKPKRLVRNILIGFFAVILATLALNAGDNIKNLSNSLLGNALSGVTGDGQACPETMVYISSPTGGYCMDRYEVSAGDACQHQNPLNQEQTKNNLSRASCVPESKAGQRPWVNISQTQAREACLKAGKHLPSNQEWFLASQGTPDTPNKFTTTDCNLNNNWGSTIGASGSGSRCQSAVGAFDMIGNVWEWTNETAPHGSFQGRDLPVEGYVHAVDEHGMPIETNDRSNNIYNDDHFWNDRSVHAGIFRGGFWGSGSDGGSHSVHAEVSPAFSGEAVGFRCAKAL